MPVCLADLASPAPTVAAKLRLASILADFASNPELQTLIVMDGDTRLGVISRTALFERAISSAPGALGQLQAGDVAEIVPSLDATEYAARVALQHHRDDYAQLRSGAFIVQDGNCIGLLELPILLRALARENAGRAKTMKALAQRMRAAELKAEQVELEAQDAARATDTAPGWPQEQMLAMLAHEVRTPLTGMIGLADMLSKRLRQADDRSMAETISRSGSALDRILRDTLDLASLRSGDLEIANEPANVADMVVDIRRLWSAHADAKGLSLQVSFRPDGPYRVRTDLGKVLQVTNNLVSNALKFTNRGSVAVEIATEGKARELSLSVQVTDTGPGLSPSQKTNIFKAFSRGEALRGEPGWGLGLTISKGLTEHLGGVLTVEDNPSGGTVFTMTVPVEPMETARIMPLFKGRKSRQKHGKFELGDILLIEDHEPCAIVLRAAIEEAGWTLHHADSLAAAEQMLSAHRYQAVLTDIHLLDGSAFGLIQKMRKHPGSRGNMPIIALTADISPQAGNVALATGADRVIRKPINAPELVACIADILVRKSTSSTQAPNIRGLTQAPLQQATA